MARRSPIPHPLDFPAWSPTLRLLGWLTLAAVAVVAIAAAATTIGSLIAARGGLLAAIFAGWLIAAVAERPIDAIEARGWSRHRAALLVYLAGGIPLVLFFVEIAISLAAPIAAIVEGPSGAEIARWASGPERLLRALGLHVAIDPLIADLVVALRAQAAAVAASAASVAGGALSAVGPIILAVVSGFLLSTSRPAIVSRLARYAPARGRGAIGLAERSIAGAFGAFITGQLLIGAAFGAAAFLIAIVGSADGLIAAVAAGIAMAVPAIGPVLAPALLVLLLLLANGPYMGIALAGTAVAWFVVANVLSPRLLTSGLRIPGWSVLVAAVVGDQIAGLAGSIVALPLLAALIAVEEAWARR